MYTLTDIIHVTNAPRPSSPLCFCKLVRDQRADSENEVMHSNCSHQEVLPTMETIDMGKWLMERMPLGAPPPHFFVGATNALYGCTAQLWSAVMTAE